MVSRGARHCARTVVSGTQSLALTHLCIGVVTNAFLWLSIACLLWNNEKIIKEMFVLPVTALFAFTTVRANLPGAPAGFGAYIGEFTTPALYCAHY